MKAGIVSLDKLYQWVGENHLLYTFEDTDEARRPYYKVCREVTQRVPEERGFYLYGRYDSAGRWRNMYLGKAGFAKTACLRERIEKELRVEKPFVWRIRMTADEIIEGGAKKSPEFNNNRLRALKKAGSTHVIWVAAPDITNDDVMKVEADLIESLNPTANHMRPVPKSVLQTKTKAVFGKIRKKIHQHRDERGKAIKLATEQESVPNVRQAHA